MQYHFLFGVHVIWSPVNSPSTLPDPTTASVGGIQCMPPLHVFVMAHGQGRQCMCKSLDRHAVWAVLALEAGG